MREDSHVAPREGRLLPRDGVQPEIRVRDNPLAIAARDLAVHLGAVSLGPVARDTLRGRADLALWLERGGLRLLTAMVDSRIDVEFGQALVGKRGPAFPPALDHFGAVPVPYLPAKSVFVHR